MAAIPRFGVSSKFRSKVENEDKVPEKTDQTSDTNSVVSHSNEESSAPAPKSEKSYSRSDSKSSENRLGFGHLPSQMHRKAMKKGLNFTVMVVGESGLGKSTLINSLFMQDFYKDREFVDAAKRIDRTTQIEKRQIDLGERGVKLHLTIIDTPGFGDALDCSQSLKPIEEYIDRTFEEYLIAETGMDRQNILDERVHCCLYFVSPFGHGLRPIDVEFMRRLQSKVNIVPVIAKADALNSSELIAFKQRLLADLERYHIETYRMPECDSEEEEDIVQLDKEIKSILPFAVIGSNCLVLSGDGRRVRGREYPWGSVEVENPQHCDFTKLRMFLLKTNMQDLKDEAFNRHYERFRTNYIQVHLNMRQAGESSGTTTLPEHGIELNGALESNALLRKKEQVADPTDGKSQQRVSLSRNISSPSVPSSHTKLAPIVTPRLDDI